MGASGDGYTERTRELARQAVGRLAPNELAFFEDTADAYFDDPARTSRKARPEPLGIGIDAVAIGTWTVFALPVAASVAANMATDFLRADHRRGWWRRRRRARPETRPDSPPAAEGTAPALPAAPTPAPDNPFAAPGQPRLVDEMTLRRIAFDRARSLGLPYDQARLLADAILGGVVADASGAAPGDTRVPRTPPDTSGTYGRPDASPASRPGPPDPLAEPHDGEDTP
jgi:hypothetical protein